MELIGVTGKSGAGKTTFSNMLAENKDIGVIHIDDILTQMKLRYFKLLMNENKDGKKIKVNSKFKIFLYRNRLIFELFMKFRAKLIEKTLEEEIERLREKGNKIIIIDDIFIKYQKKYNDLSRIFIISRPYAKRREALKQRDDLTKEEIVANDVAHFKGNYKELSERNNIIKITNNGTHEDLRLKANQVYSKYFMSFREKYKEEALGTDKTELANRDVKTKVHKEERD